MDRAGGHRTRQAEMARGGEAPGKDLQRARRFGPPDNESFAEQTKSRQKSGRRKGSNLSESNVSRSTVLLVLAGLAAGLIVAFATIASKDAGAQSNTGSGTRGGGGGETTMMPGETTMMPPGGEEEIGEVIVGRGSDTTYNVSLQLASLYNGAPELGAEGVNPNRDIVLNAQPEGSSVGIQQLGQFAEGEDDSLATAFARSSRAPRAGDPSGLTFTSFARDGIVPVTFGEAENSPAADVENLSVRQLRRIFVTCQITNWSQLGGESAPIEVFGLQEGSGTKATFDAFLNGDTSNCVSEPDNIIFENSLNPILEAFEDNPEEIGRAILPFSFARFSTSVPNPDARAVAVGGVEADPDTISTQRYPLNRLVYFVTVEDDGRGDPEANEAADGFVDFVCGSSRAENPITGNSYLEDVDNVIESNGFGLVGRCRDTVSGSGATSVRVN